MSEKEQLWACVEKLSSIEYRMMEAFIEIVLAREYLRVLGVAMVWPIAFGKK